MFVEVFSAHRKTTPPLHFSHQAGCFSPGLFAPQEISYTLDIPYLLLEISLFFPPDEIPCVFLQHNKLHS